MRLHSLPSPRHPVWPPFLLNPKYTTDTFGLRKGALLLYACSGTINQLHHLISYYFVILVHSFHTHLSLERNVNIEVHSDIVLNHDVISKLVVARLCDIMKILLRIRSQRSHRCNFRFAFAIEIK